MSDFGLARDVKKVYECTRSNHVNKLTYYFIQQVVVRANHCWTVVIGFKGNGNKFLVCLI